MLNKLLMLLLFSLFMPSAVFAQTPTVTSAISYPTSAILKNNDALTRQSIKDLLMRKKENHQQRKDALQLKIQQLKDTRRKNLILKLDDKIASISSKRAESMTDALEKLEGILLKIKAKSGQISGCDTTKLNKEIESAQESIASASSAVDILAVKTYDLDFNSEDSVKTNVGVVIKQLTQDLKTAHQNIMKAKQMTINTATELKKLKSCPRITIVPTQNTVTPNVSMAPTDI